jgi:hypothetical protein
MMNYFQMDDADPDIDAAKDADVVECASDFNEFIVNSFHEAAKNADDAECATDYDTDSDIDVEEDQNEVLRSVSPSSTCEDAWNQNEIKALEDFIKSSELRIKMLEDETKAFEDELEWDMPPPPMSPTEYSWELESNTGTDGVDALEDAIKSSEFNLKTIEDEISVLEAELKILEDDKSTADDRQLHGSPAMVPAKNTDAATDAKTKALPSKHSVNSSGQTKLLASNGSVNASAKRSVVQPPAVPELRFQGKIKVRDDNPLKQRGNRMNYGWIEVNRKDLKALREHPLWTSELEQDVFFHNSDCCYDGQFGDDIVTFSVSLNRNGGALQAREVKLKRRWWQSDSAEGEWKI